MANTNEPPAAQPGRLRIVSWNLRNFPLDERPEESPPPTDEETPGDG